MPSFKIRGANLKDLDVLVEHRRAMFEEMPRMTPEERRGAANYYREWAKDMMKQKLFRGYVVETGTGKVAASGCVWLRQVQPSRGRPATLIPYVLSMYTHPDFRRNGLASMIIKEAMAWSKRKGYARITLHASVVGRKVYSQLGWKRTYEMEYRFDKPAKSHSIRGGGAPRPSKRARDAT